MQHPSHVLDLQLESRVAKADDLDKDLDDRMIFTVGFSDEEPPCRWHCLNIRVLFDEDSEITKTVSKVRFAASTPMCYQKLDLSKLQAIDCLCSAISSSQGQLPPDLCVNHQHQLLGHHSIMQQDVNAGPSRSGPATSLSQVLLAPKDAGRRRPFSSKQAYSLGLTIASSFLQLRATPWLSGTWCKRDILFIQEDDSHLINFDRPYIRQIHSGQQQSMLSTQAPGSANDADDNCSFLNLGIMLLEIFFRESIEAHRPPEFSAANQSFSDLQTVRCWIREEREEMPIGFYKAVCFCISCFASPNVDLLDTEFRQTVVNEVIVPLKEEYNIWHT